MDYEFRFFRGAGLEAVHVTAAPDDETAAALARVRLAGSEQFSAVEVRRGRAVLARIGRETRKPPA